MNISGVGTKLTYVLMEYLAGEGDTERQEKSMPYSNVKIIVFLCMCLCERDRDMERFYANWSVANVLL